MAKQRHPFDDSEQTSGADMSDVTPETQDTLTTVMGQMAQVLALLTERQTASPDTRILEMQERLSAAMERMAANTLAGSEMIAKEQRRSTRPSNEVAHMRSAYNLRGELLPDYQKPVLKCKMLLPWEADDASLTREEVELLNLLGQPGTFRLRRNDGSRVEVSVQVRYEMDGETPSVILINSESGFIQENHRLMPALTDIIRQILNQCGPETKAKASVVLTMDEERDLIEAGRLTVSA